MKRALKSSSAWETVFAPLGQRNSVEFGKIMTQSKYNSFVPRKKQTSVRLALTAFDKYNWLKVPISLQLASHVLDYPLIVNNRQSRSPTLYHNRNRKLEIFTALTKAKSRKPAHSQALVKNKIDRQRLRSRESGRQTVTWLWWMVFGVETGEGGMGKGCIRIEFAESSVLSLE